MFQNIHKSPFSEISIFLRRSIRKVTRFGEPRGFSYVDLIEDRHSRKLYAIKRITCHSKEDERMSMQEVEIMKTFRHVNLCPCEASSLVPINDHMRTVVSEVLIVMPYFRKGTLQDEIDLMSKKLEHIREERILRLSRGICEGLKKMHQFNPPYAHRDIKPANVVLENDDTPVLMDFGSSAKARVDIKNSSEALKLQDIASEKCTMPYRAPELFNVQNFKVIDEKVDIWSLGCTIYALAYLESPFDQAYQKGDSIALAVMGRNVKYPERSVYSSNLVELIDSLLVVEPDERPDIDWVIRRIDFLESDMQNRI